MRPKLFDDMIVSLDTPEQVQLWTKEFDVSLPGLQLAMSKAGNRFNDIREQLGMARLYFFPRNDSVMHRLAENGPLERQI
jgi:hypothetical protein